MIEKILFLTHGALLLLFGAFISGAFAGISFRKKKNIWMFLALCAFIGVLQLITLFAFGEEAEWKLYPLTTHLPLAIFLCVVYKRRLEPVLATIFTAYLFCQPVKWFGVLAYYISHSETIEYIVRIGSLLALAYLVLWYLAPYFARIYNGDTRRVRILALMPMIYYIFDYIAIVYTDLWIDNNRVVAEFLPLMLVFIYMTVTILYSNEVEEKMSAEHKASIVKITSEQQKKEIEAIKRNEHEIKLLHHDMRLFLSTLSVCLEEEDYNKAKDMLSSYSSHIDNTRLKKYCGVDTINYILLSVKNPVSKPPHFVDGLPVSKREGHGYGTQSIRYMTERLNGKWQFSVKNNTFILKVII